MSIVRPRHRRWISKRKTLEERLEHVLQLLRDKRPVLDRIAAVLLAKEVLKGDAFAQMVREDTKNAQREPDRVMT